MLQVHDEVILEVPPEEEEAAAEAVTEAMTGAADLRVPLTINLRGATPGPTPKAEPSPAARRSTTAHGDGPVHDLRSAGPSVKPWCPERRSLS